jgi:hypothetical protein
MPKRRKDADTRRFFDEFQSVRVSRLRADGTIDPSRRDALIPFPDGTTKLIATAHTWFKKGGGWSYFRCPKCDRRTPTLYLIDKAPRCSKCCEAMNIQHRSKYGFGYAARRLVKDKQLDATIAKLETQQPLRLKPAPASWGAKAARVYNTSALTLLMRKRMVELRLSQIAMQTLPGEGIASHLPSAAARQLVNVKDIWRAPTTESLQRALDKAQIAILSELNSDDPERQRIAATLMLNTKQGRQRNFSV